MSTPKKKLEEALESYIKLLEAAKKAAREKTGPTK